MDVFGNFSSLMGCACATAALVADSYLKCQVKGVLIPKNCGIDACVAQLNGPHTQIIDFDSEVRNDLTPEEKSLIDSSHHLTMCRKVYCKGKIACQEIQEIVKSSSHSIKQFVILSSDYKLLKYAGCSSVEYFWPSQSYHDELVISNGSQWNEPQFQQLRTQIISSKSDKLQIYTSELDLLNQLVKLFPDLSHRV